jgi:PA14 domain-containing protein
MNRRRSRVLFASAAAVLLAAFLPADRAGAAVPPQEPGVTLRVFDLQTPRTAICVLKPGQTPNVDKLMPVINWTTAADFGLEDNFQAQVIANLNVTAAGSYAFRLTSDDGSRLAVDDTTVIANDGLHGATAKEGTVSLTTGYHAVRVDFFEATGGMAAARRERLHGDPLHGAEHRLRRGAGDLARPQGMRGRHGQPR